MVRFPDDPRSGSDTHTDALRRLSEAREHQHDMRDALDASRDEPGRRVATSELAAARERTAAREAWVVWVERGY